MDDLIKRIKNLQGKEMDAMMEALKNRPVQPKKIHTALIDGKLLEVSLNQKLQIQQAGESAFMLQDGKIVRKPVKKRQPLKFPTLKKHKTGGHFYEGDPYWIENIAEDGYVWTTESE